MKRRVIGFFALLFIFAIALGVLSFLETGKISNVTGYSVAVEDESHSSNSYGILLFGIFGGLIFVYVVKFIFDSYERKFKETKFKRTIEIDLD